MRKILLFGTLSLLLTLAGGLTKSFAGGCTANCKFSSCTIGGCTGQYACGCYFGIASCKCETNTGVPGGSSSPGGDKGTMKKKTFNKQAIDDFNNYAANSGYQGLVAVGRVLQQFTEENFDAVFESYKAEISQLSDRELELLKLYTEQ